MKLLRGIFLCILLVCCSTATATSIVRNSVNIITGEYSEADTDLVLYSAHPIAIKRSFSPSVGWYLNYPNILNSTGDTPPEIVFPNVRVACEYDAHNRLSSLETTDLEGNTIFDHIQCFYTQHRCEIETEQGHTVSYDLESNLIKKVVAPGTPACTYTYKTIGGFPQIVSKQGPEGRFRSFEYDYLGRVIQEKTPLGIIPHPTTKYRYIYHEGYTEVFDARDQKTIYRYDDVQQLTAVENYRNDTLYRAERFSWHGTLPTEKRVEDADGNILFRQTYAYNPDNQLVKETLHGDLSGTNQNEQYSKMYTYNDHHLLISEMEDNGKTIRYVYDPETQLLTAKFICKGNAIQIRQFYLYNNNHIRFKTIIDDGYSEEIDNLAGVTERHITELTLRETAPAAGLPEIIEERYLDLQSGQEIPLKSTIHTYSNQGQLIQQDVFDANGDYRYSQYNDYDEEGRLISSTNHEGETTEKTYDANGNTISVVKMQHDGTFKTTAYAYDFANRPICVKTDDMSMTNFYDIAGCVSTTVDPYGNKTQYEYDELGRLIKTISPEVLDANDSVIRPTSSQHYDIFDRVIKKQDPNGSIIQTRYNVRNQPILIIYPDQSVERFEYNLDGTLLKATAKNGSYTIYERDFLGRTTLTEVFSPEGQLLSCISTTYNANHITSHTDPMGNVTLYTYDGAGRQISMTTGEKRIDYEYDALGDLSTQKEWFGYTASDYSIIVKNEEETRIEDAFEAVLARYATIESETDLPEERDIHVNVLGQTVPKVTRTDPTGRVTILLYDALGRIASRIQKDPFGQVFAKQEYRYDGVGNKMREINHVISTDHPTRTIVTAWKYNANNQIHEVTEAFGSAQQRTTYYCYDFSGKLRSTTKPDGVELVYKYNSLGQLSRTISSDGSIDYAYTYDPCGNVIEATDRINGTNTSRVYDPSGNVIAETLAHNLSLINTYDRKGRRTQVTLPDGSDIQYGYDAAFLRTIHRKSPSHEYTHFYTEYNQYGQVTSAKLIKNLGTLSYAYDDKHRAKTIATPYWLEEITYDSEGNTAQLAISDAQGTVESSFNYEPNGQLCEEPEHSYQYDSIYNRTSKSGSSYHVDELNQLLCTDGASYTYDRNGNLIKKKTPNLTTFYSYDALNRLTHIREGDRTIMYGYDAFNRRITRTVGSDTTRFLYDGDNEIGSVDNRDRILELRILGVGLGAEMGAAIAMELCGHVYAPIHDHRGSVRCLVDADTQTVDESYRYTAFGEEQISGTAGAPRNPWRFSSKRCDPTTELVFFGKRDYDPSIGRWITKDPLGFIDSPNRYAYALNNPMFHVDLYGLFSFSDVWHFIGDCFNQVVNFGSEVIAAVRHRLSYINYIAPDLEDFFGDMFGPSYLLMSGFYDDEPGIGVYGEGEFSDKVRVTMINGILNTRPYYIDSIKELSESHGGINIHYVFRATEGWTQDILQCFLIKVSHDYISPQARYLASLWKSLIDEMGGVEGGGLIVHYAHSLGGTDTYAAAKLLSAEEKKMLRIITFGSATMILNGEFESATNYVSKRDGVALLGDPFGQIIGLIRNDGSIVYVGTIKGPLFVDHPLNVDTYVEILKDLGKRFLGEFPGWSDL